MRCIAVALFISGTLAAADAPYAGKWKMDVAKSDFGSATLTYEAAPGGAMKATMDGQSYTFKMDGKEVQTPWGSTASWKAVDANNWDMVEKVNGKQMAVTKVKLSADGKALTWDTKRTKADGGTSNDSMTMTRISGGPGLAGKWKMKNMNSSSPETLVLSSKPDGVAIMVGNMGGGCDAKFDGKEYPAKGSMFPSGWTCKIAKSGDKAIDVTWRKDGKDMYRSTMSASADGKTLTESGSPVGVDEKFKIVYNRQ